MDALDLYLNGFRQNPDPVGPKYAEHKYPKTALNDEEL
jgi:hypothetical protein